jgi:hypothetical protein
VTVRRKRRTPPDDIDRLAENYWTRHKGKVRTKEDFEKSYNDYIAENYDPENDFLKRAKNSVWNILISDPKYKVEKVTTIEAKPVKRGKPRQFTVEKRVLDTPAKVKQSIVYSSKDQIKRKGRSVFIFRDGRGRFARPIK